MERKLASIQRIDHLESIPGADNIVKARVMGWDVVVKKGEFFPGAPCVFFEIDSMLPEGASWAEFMRPRGFRVRTARLRGVLSQGLALPISILDESLGKQVTGSTWETMTMRMGLDVTEQLGVRKYELPEDSSLAAPFPSRVPKTGMLRLQSALGVLEELKDKPVYITTKLDGQSTTFMKEDGKVLACSWKGVVVEDDLRWSLLKKYDFESLPEGCAVQGELVGPGIRKNRLGLKELDFFVFGVFNTSTSQYLPHELLVRFCEMWDLKMVPVEHVDVAPTARTLEDYLKLASGVYEGTTNRKEGIVVQTVEEVYSPSLGGRLCFKVLNNDFLLKDED